jgi:hypothetical protein
LPLTTYKDFYFIDWVHGSALHGNRCTAGCEVHINFAHESACLKADKVWNGVVTIHRSQEVLKMLYLYIQIFFATVSLKERGTRHQVSMDGGRTLWVRCRFCELQ